MEASPPDRLPRLCEVPSPKSTITSRRALVVVPFLTVNVTVATLPAPGVSDAHDPVPDAGAHVIAIPGPGRAVTFTVPVLVPAAAVTFVSTDVTSVVVACPLLSVTAVDGFRAP